MKIREAGEADAAEIVEVYTYGESIDDRLERVRRFGWWGDEEALAWYLKALKSVGGVSLVAEEEGEVVGEAEIAPDKDPSLVGEHAFLLSLWVHPKWRGRGIARSLLEGCIEVARSWGFNTLDTVPFAGTERFFANVGFSKVATQLVVEAETRVAPELAGLVKLGPDDYPERLAMLAGHFRPGRLSWRLLWGQSEIGLALPSPQAYAVRMGSWNFTILLYAQPSRNGPLAVALMWGEPRVSSAQVFGALEVSLRLASEAGFARVRSQPWERFRSAFAAAGFVEKEKRPWLRKTIRPK